MGSLAMGLTTAAGAACYTSLEAVVSTPDARQLVVVANKVCRTGLRIPDLTGWSEGRCVIPGTCGGSVTAVGWRIDRSARTIVAHTFDDKALCTAPLLPGDAPLWAQHFQGDLPSGFGHCNRYRQETPADAEALALHTMTRGAAGYVAEHYAFGRPLRYDGALPAGMTWRKAQGFPLQINGRDVLRFDEDSKAPAFVP